MMLGRAAGPSLSRAGNVARYAGLVCQVQVRWATRKTDAEYGAWLRDACARAGPAAIKFGQFLSTRSDVLPKDAAVELARLQDGIDPEPWPAIRAVLEEDVGLGAFASVDPQCIASASIGQVHVGVLAGSGERVAIKVCKPGVARAVRQDLDCMRAIAEVLAALKHPRAPEVLQTLGDFDRFLTSELDFEAERANMLDFAALLADKPIKIPRVHEDLCSARVLTMEYVPSTKITDADALRALGADLPAVSARLLRAFVDMLLERGVLHCDPHPGNVGVGEDGETLVLYDFGNVARVDPGFQDAVQQLLFALVQKDAHEFVDVLLSSGVLVVKAPHEVGLLKQFFESLFRYLGSLDLAALKEEVIAGSRGASPTVALDPKFSSIMRAFALLDGTCARLDPGLDYFEALAPVATQFMDASVIRSKARRDMDRLAATFRGLQAVDRNVREVREDVAAVRAQARLTWASLAVLIALQAAGIAAQ